eukprot:g9931.t1
MIASMKRRLSQISQKKSAKGPEQGAEGEAKELSSPKNAGEAGRQGQQQAGADCKKSLAQRFAETSAKLDADLYELERRLLSHPNQRRNSMLAEEKARKRSRPSLDGQPTDNTQEAAAEQSHSAVQPLQSSRQPAAPSDATEPSSSRTQLQHNRLPAKVDPDLVASAVLDEQPPSPSSFVSGSVLIEQLVAVRPAAAPPPLSPALHRMQPQPLPQPPAQHVKEHQQTAVPMAEADDTPTSAVAAASPVAAAEHSKQQAEQQQTELSKALTAERASGLIPDSPRGSTAGSLTSGLMDREDSKSSGSRTAASMFAALMFVENHIGEGDNDGGEGGPSYIDNEAIEATLIDTDMLRSVVMVPSSDRIEGGSPSRILSPPSDDLALADDFVLV